MSATPVKVNRVDPAAGGSAYAGHAGAQPGRAELEADLARARTLARWLDSKFEIAGIKFGFDTLIGLIPVAGDTITSAIGLFPIYVARRHNLGKALQARMAFNVAVDWCGGLIPLAGDVVDVLYKANLKNLRLLERAVEKKLERESA